MWGLCAQESDNESPGLVVEGPPTFTALPLMELKGQPGFKIGHLNICSLPNKIDQLRIDLPESGFDVFTISETWLNSCMEDRLTSVPGYQFMRADRKTKRLDGQIKQGGGLGIYSKTDLHIDTSKYMDLNLSNCNIELQWAIIIRPHTKSILIGNIYRPPDGNVNEGIDLLNESMRQITDLDKYEILILGDFNVDYDGGKKDPVGNNETICCRP